jgi:hypothetical protein
MPIHPLDFPRFSAELLEDFAMSGNSEPLHIDHYSASISSLDGSQAAFLAFEAVLAGNEGALRFLFKVRGLFEVAYQSPSPGQHFINGVEYTSPGLKRLIHLRSRAALKSLLKAVDEFGMKGFTQPGETAPLLFVGLSRNDRLEDMSVERFSGDLPYLNAGVLQSPELAIALRHEGLSNPHANAYNHMLCWATPEMVSTFAGALTPLQPFQEVYSGLGPAMAMVDFKAQFQGSGSVPISAFHMGVRAPDRQGYSVYMMESLCPIAPFFGFNDLDGRVLCETTTDFLLGFELAPVTESNTQAAKDFAKDYCPIEIITTHVLSDCARDFGHADEGRWIGNAAHFQHYREAFNPVFRLLSNDHPLRDRALSMLSAKQWKMVLEVADHGMLTGSSVVACHQAFGIDNTGLNLSISPDSIDAFLAAGFRFNEDTRFFDSYPAFRDHRESKEGKPTTSVYCNFSGWTLPKGGVERTDEEFFEHMTRQLIDVVIKLNIWPSSAERPKDLADAVMKAGSVGLQTWSDNHSMGLRAMIVHAGIEACSKVATDAPAWLALTEAFTAQELAPYLKLMPHQAKGRLLEQDLGM